MGANFVRVGALKSSVPRNVAVVKICVFYFLISVFRLQCYDSKFLAVYPHMPTTPLQVEEDLEQLKVLENGYRMKVSSFNT